MGLVLPLAAWPAADRMLWDALFREGGPLDDRGALAQLRKTSRWTLLAHYGRWLGWLQAQDPEALDLPPVDRASLDRLRVWLADLAHTRPMSQWSFVGDVIRLLSAAAPERDWSAHKRLKARLRRRAGAGDRSRKAGRVLSSSVLLEAGLRLATVEAEVATTPLGRWKRQRDGLMVAFLALVPIRRRAMIELTLGQSLRVEARRIVIDLAADLTKTGVAWSCTVPEAIADLMRHYLAEVRPALMARGDATHDRVWVGDRGAPYQGDHFGSRIGDITEGLTGVRVTPHLFRDAAATTLARVSPVASRLIKPVLAHLGDGTAERHYIDASTIEAGRALASLVARLRKEV